MTRWEERAIEVEAHAAMGDVEHAQAVIAHELEAAWRAGMDQATDIARNELYLVGRMILGERVAAAIRAEAAK